MSDAEQVLAALRERGLTSQKLRLTALAVLRLCGLERALAFVYRQRPRP